MSDFTFNTTPSIRQQAGGAKRLAELVATLPRKAEKPSILFVTDPGIIKLGLATAAMDSLASAGYSVVLFKDVEADPKAQTILAAVELARSERTGMVIGFGGGSSMDVAKLIALLVDSEQQLDDVYGVNQACGNRLPLILVPTTAGTGSEVTAVSIVTTGVEEKKGVVSPIILPDIALLDAELTLGLPAHITAATGIDAMVHAIEAYTSKNVNNNPLSQMLAKQALSLLGANISDAVFNGSNMNARSNMLLGSMLAGQAFANSPVAAVHALAYPIGSQFHVPHGLSNALVLPHVMRFSAPECASQYAELAPIVFPDIETSGSDDSLCDRFIERLAALSEDLGLEVGLKQVGIKAEDVEKLTIDAMKQTRLLVNNPRELGFEDIKSIYQQAL